MATGKTVSRYVTITLDDSAGTPRNITASINNVGGVGMTYGQSDVTTFADEVMQYLSGRGDSTIDIGGPFNNTAVAAAPAESGAHAVFPALAGQNIASTLTISIGIRAAPTGGDPKFFGEYTVLSYVNSGDLSNWNWTAQLKPAFGASTPAWSTV